MNKEIEVVCASCKKLVTVKPIVFGYGLVALCPKCGNIALNEPLKSEGKIEKEDS